MNTSQISRNTAAALTGSSAALGYFLLNYAARGIVGTPLAVLAGIISSSLNAIFHSLPVQRAKLPKSCSDIAFLTLSMAAATLSTGYIYASSEKSVEDEISDSDATGMAIAGLYQLSYILPIGFVLHDLVAHKIKSCLPDQPRPKAAEAELLPDDTLPGAIGKSEAALSCRCSATDIALNVMAYGAGLGMLYVSASAAYQLFRSDQDPSAISQAYYPIYGKAFYAAFLAHLPQLPLAGESSKEGAIATVACIADLVQEPDSKKGAVAGVALLILGLTAITTYLIASYGQVELFPLILAMITAVLGNYVPAVKCSQFVVQLAGGRCQEASACLTSSEAVGSFLKARKAEVQTGYVALEITGADKGAISPALNV